MKGDTLSWQRDFILAGLLLLAFAARAYELTQPLVDAFSWRQASTGMMADNFQNSSWNIFYPEVSWTGPGPSYQGRELQITTYIVAILYEIFGWHDWFGRLVSAIFGTATVYFFYRIAEKAWGVTEARTGALILAIAPGPVFIDRSFLPDPAMLTLITAGTWFFMRHADERRTWQLLTATGLTTLGVLAKLPGIGAVLALAYLALAPLIARRRFEPAYLVQLTIAAAAGLAAVSAYYAWAIHLGTSYPPYHVAGSGFIWQDGLASFIDNRFHVEKTWKKILEWYAPAPFVVLFVVGLVAATLSPRGRPGHRRVFHFWLGGFLAVYLVAAREMANNPWNYHALSIPFAAFAGKGLAIASGWFEGNVRLAARALRTTAIVALLVAMGTIPGYRFYYEPYAMQGYQLGKALEQASKPGDLVVAIAPTVGDPIAIYYSRRRGWVFPPGGGAFDWTSFQEDGEAVTVLIDLMNQGANWFGVAKKARDRYGRRFFDHHPKVVEFLESISPSITETEDYVIYHLR